MNPSIAGLLEAFAEMPARLAALERAVSTLAVAVGEMRAEVAASRAAAPRNLSIRAAAEHFGVSTATVRRKVKDGTWPHFRIKQRIVVEVGAIRTVGDTAEAARLRVNERRRGIVSVSANNH